MAQTRHHKRKKGQVPEKSGGQRPGTREEENYLRVVFTSTANVSDADARTIRAMFAEYFLGTGQYEDLKQIRVRQGVPPLLQERGHAVFEKQRDLDNGDGFQLVVRTDGSQKGLLIARFHRFMMRGDMGPFDRLAKRKAEDGTFNEWWERIRRPNHGAGYSHAMMNAFYATHPEDALLGMLFDSLTMVPDLEEPGRVILRYTVEMVAPPTLIVEEKHRTLFTPDPWLKLLVLTDPEDQLARRCASFLITNRDDLGNLEACLEADTGVALVLRMGDNIPTKAAAKHLLDGIQAAIPGLVHSFVVEPDVTEADLVEVVKNAYPKSSLSKRGVPPGSFLILPSASQARRGAGAGGFGLKQPFDGDPNVVEAAIGVISEVFQADSYSDDIEHFDSVMSENKSEVHAREVLDKELSRTTKTFAEEVRRTRREAQAARAQAKTLESEAKRLEIARAREREDLLAKVRDLEGRLGTLTAEMEPLRLALDAATRRAESSEEILEASSGKPMEEFNRLLAVEASLRAELEAERHKVGVLEGDIAKAGEENATLRRRLHDARMVLESLGAMTGGSGVDASEDEQRRVRTLAVLGGAPTLEQGLLFLQENFGDRLTVLTSAVASARQADVDGFLYGARAFGMMKALVTTYWEALASGQGDTKAKDYFGKDGYAARESDTGEGNERMRRERTFTWKGVPIYMGRHLKIGFRADPRETWRCHFHWDAEAKRIVIGHCGHHLWKLGF